jgi:inhibitor of cysteine peptidase
MKKIIVVAVLSALAIGCSNKHGINNGNAILHQFKSCNAIDKARTYKESERYYTYGVPLGVPVAAGSNDAAMSETNNQVAGVDELDNTKADGDFVYRLVTDYEENKNSLIVLRRSPANQAGVVQRINLGKDEPRGVFVTDDQAIVLLAHSDDNDSTRILSYDRHANGTLTKKIERKVEGYINTARLIGSNLHLVTNDYIGGLAEDAEDDSASIEKVLPKAYKDEDVIATKCTDIWREDAVEESGNYGYGILDSLTGVLSFDINDDHSIPTGAWIAGNYSSTVFVSQTNLFLASYGWNEGTPVHQFRLEKNQSKTKYIGSVLVAGSPINQFAMDEFDGYFRIAVTEFPEFGNCSGDVCVMTDEPVNQSSQSSSVYTYKLNEGDPIAAGELKGLGVNEQIFAVRFMGDRAYVVTFEQKDPLFAIDLKDQDKPILKGELIIPGFSNYLHPMSDGYLLGIGQSADNDGFVNGMALSIFDVRNLSDPKLVHKIKIGSAGTQSEAQYDHHAFRFIPETDQLVIPINVMNSNYETTFAGFRIYDVSITDGFDLLGESAFVDEDNIWEFTSRAFYNDGTISMLGGGEMVLRNASSPDVDVARIDLN